MGPEQAGNPLIQLFPFAAIFLIFYFIVLRPQQDKQKQLKNMVANLKRNDRVVTVAGIHGTVLNIKDTTIIVRIDDNAKMEVDKEAIASVTNASPNS